MDELKGTTRDPARRFLARFIDMYEGMDVGAGDPVHDVRVKAQEFLDAGPTEANVETILEMIAAALPHDRRAASLGLAWDDERRGRYPLK